MGAARTFLAAAGLGTGLAMALTTGAAHAAATSYVALGDSYSSGTGTRSYLSDGTRASGRCTPTRRCWPRARTSP